MKIQTIIMNFADIRNYDDIINKIKNIFYIYKDLQRR
jgi:hypothetical protein